MAKDLKASPPNPQASASAAPAIQKVLASVEEGAAAIGVCRTLCYRLIKEGKLHAVKIGGRTLIPVSELAAFALRLQAGA
jgi:excisionase family DNA binding protein